MKNWILVFSLLTTFCFSQTPPHANAHAHNDYEQSNPLFDALKNGFTSIEADVHLVKDRLLVSHNRPVPGTKSLEALYLEPLDSIIQRNGGFIYPEYNRPVVLLIDIKTNGEATFKSLTRLLLKYEKSLSTPSHSGMLKIVISGNRPIELIRSDPRHLSTIDGRPEDLGMGFSSEEMPIVSENYTKIVKWNGKGSPSSEELSRLKELARRVHGENKKLRLWEIPDNENTWGVLLTAGVDIINTDKLQELNIFLMNRKK